MAKEITIEDVRHIAKLARIELSPEEETKFTEQFGNILEFVKQLQSVDTSGVEEISQITGLENVWTKDENRPSFTNDQALKNAPDKEGECFRVKEIL